jgi:copper oxidase (laccase) domain-containing protein
MTAFCLPARLKFSSESVEDLAIRHAGRAGHFAGTAQEAVIRMLLEVVPRRQLTLGPALNQRKSSPG